MIEAFNLTHKSLDNTNIDYQISGTTVCSVFIFGTDLYCCNLGDSRAIIGSNFYGSVTTTSISNDHKPDVIFEKNRILANNGRIEQMLSI